MKNLKTHQMISMHTPPEKFENGVFTLKTYHMFFVHTTELKFENIVFEVNSVRDRKSHDYREIMSHQSFLSSSVFEMFPEQTKS